MLTLAFRSNLCSTEKKSTSKTGDLVLRFHRVLSHLFPLVLRRVHENDHHVKCLHWKRGVHFIQLYTTPTDNAARTYSTEGAIPLWAGASVRWVSVGTSAFRSSGLAPDSRLHCPPCTPQSLRCVPPCRTARSSVTFADMLQIKLVY